jgi:hypothetical protein
MPDKKRFYDVKMNRVFESDLNTFKRNVVDAVGIPTPENGYTFSSALLTVPTKAEKIVYTSLATLGGIVIGLVTYLQFIR